MTSQPYRNPDGFITFTASMIKKKHENLTFLKCITVITYVYLKLHQLHFTYYKRKDKYEYAIFLV